ncbi:MAG TPA: hypothetical protein VGJ28_19975, partial [Micromonosporaceae bacterium]
MIEKDQAAPAKIGWLLPVLSLIWLGIALWAAHGQIHSNSSGGSVALATAAEALPGVVQATLVAGTGLALLIAAWLLRNSSSWLRWVGGAVAGAIAGGVAAVGTKIAYPHLPSITSIAVTLIITGAIGGVLTAIPRIQPAVRAGLAAALGALAVITIINANAVLSRLLNLYGFSATSPADALQASKYVQYTEYGLGGIAAGLIAFLYLRRRQVRQAPQFPLAGALPGLVVLVAYALTSIGGHALLDAANRLSDADRVLNRMELAETVPNALLVLFIGALVALIAFGRTLEPRGSAGAASSSAKPSVAGGAASAKPSVAGKPAAGKSSGAGKPAAARKPAASSAGAAKRPG